MIKDKKEKQSGGSSASGSSSGSNGNSKSNNNANNASNSSNTNNSSTSSPSSSKTSSSNSSSSKSSSSNSNKNNILGIKEEIIEQGPTEQLIVTSIKHEDGSPPTNIIKKEPANSASTPGNGPGSASGSNVNSNDSNNNNDTNDNKNSSNLSGNLMPDEKDSANDNSIADELLNNDELNTSGNGNNSNTSKLGMHIKNEDPSSDPLAGVDNNLNANNFGGMNPQQQPGSNRPTNSPERIQALPSNVVNKQSNSMDYMQQQSQIFVFSTALANKGAEAVRSGQFQTIIAYHCAQPETRKFLQKFPLKVNQFNRSGPGWFPQNMGPNMNNNKKPRMMPMNQQNFNFMKNNAMNPQQCGPGGGPMGNQMGMHPGNGGFQSSCDMNNPDGNNMGMWGSGNQQMNMDPLGNGPSIDPLLSDPIDSLVNDPLSANSLGNLPQGPMGNNANSCMDPTSPNIPSLQGVKVPDEDLTPQQRQQRAMKLAQLQELKQMFKQEHPHMNPNDMNQMNEQENPAGMPGACSKMGPNAMNPMMQGGPGGMMNTPPHHGPMNSMNMNGPMRPNFPPGMGPRGGNMNMCRPPMGPNMGMNPEEMMGGGPCNQGGGGMNNMSMGPGGMMGMPPQMQGNNMGMVPGSCMMPGGPQGMGGPMGQKGNMSMAGGPGNMQQQMDWNKMQQQYYDENNKRKGPMMGGMDMPGNEMNPNMGGNRMPPNAMRNMPNMPPNMRVSQQGPPPPYHQTPRSASVPIATQSPNPNSPNNPTSNLSLPSPRAGSTLNSPAAGDPTRMNPQQFKHMNPRQSPTTSSQDSPAMGRQINHSNPSTPISSHLSPSASLKDLDMSTNPNNKEPNLMPVPSPQQISYLNTFEGQELTIQKQPNTNINKDGTPNIGGPNQANLNLDNRLPGQKTPTSSANPHMNNFSIPSSPHTTGAPTLAGDKNRINSAGPSPQNNLQRTNSMMGNDPTQFSPHPQGNNQQSNESNMQFPTDTPNMPFGPNVPQNSNKMPNFMDQKPGDGVGPPQFPSCSGRPENLPLNPNSNPAMPNTKPSHFDPISSLAQMSQQLTSTGVPTSMNGQPMMGGFNNNGMMNDMGPMGMPDGQMDFGGNMGNMGPNQFPMGGPRSMSPKIGPQMGFPPNGPGGGMPPNMRMVRPPMGYNGTNIQVKPNAPNTIQYLPARPQMNNPNPQRPPSLEFLQRFTNPMGMDEMNKGAAPNAVGNQQNMPYFPNQNNPNPCMGSGMGDPMDGGPPPPGMMNQNPMMMRGAGMRGGNMRFPGPPGGNINNPCMMGNNSFNSSNNPNMNDQHQMMFGGGGPNQQNPQMFVAGPKSSPIGPPNAEMQMMGGGGNGPHFNKQQQSHFPSTADPNYAQQYHNFQQQLYATSNNSNQRNQMGMGGNQAPFMPK